MVLILCPDHISWSLLSTFFLSYFQIFNKKSVADFGHFEQKLPDGTVRGVYDVLLPDGRRQVVEYTADKNGFHPIIKYVK